MSRLRLLQLETRLTPATGYFTELASPLPNTTVGVGTMMLLTNGEVLAQQGYTAVTEGATSQFYLLTPDAQGNYALGSWSLAGSLNTARLDYGSNVLPNGDVFVVGGEYADHGNSEVNTAEVYSPATNSWTAVAHPFPQTSFGDGPTELLPALPGQSQYDNGEILAGYIDGPQTYLYSAGAPLTSTWTNTGTALTDGTLGKLLW